MQLIEFKICVIVGNGNRVVVTLTIYTRIQYVKKMMQEFLALMRKTNFALIFKQTVRTEEYEIWHI